ncbi:hypothetical protein F6455_11250 [Proteobacteria bacterium 005FR1]|nr:hypothetical protein [Proteobacteria bacterium 005FR1]
MHGPIGDFFLQIVILLAGAAALSTLFYRFNIPALLAFLLVGLGFGPTGLGVVQDPEELHSVAELGLTFLLFMLGLEFSLARLKAMRDTVLKLGGSQVLVCTAAFFLAFYWWGLPWQTALVVAGGLSLSSTAIVSRELSQLGQLHERHGQIAIGVLLFQDIVAVALLIAVPLFAGGQQFSSVGEVLMPVAQSAILLAVFFFAARFLLPRILAEVARSRSNELLVLTALVIVLVAGLITSWVGLSMELGAFLAGMMLGDSRFRHQLEADIRPFRDLLLGLFFISIGMLIDLGMLQEYWFRILYSGLLLLAFKCLVIAAVARLLGENLQTALTAGLVLAQGGEFLFALLALAARDGLVEADVASFLLSVTIVSMSLTPLLIRLGPQWIAGLLQRFSISDQPAVDESMLLDSEARENHVVLLGFGRVGQTIARYLRRLNIPYLALEVDAVRVAEARAAGEPVFFGDSSRADILQAAGLAQASLAVISFDNDKEAKRILESVRGLDLNLPVLTRTRDDRNLQELLDAGGTEVVPETLEASLTLVSHVLLMLSVPEKTIHRLINDTRRDRYRMLRGFFPGGPTLADNEEAADNAVLQHAVIISREAWACGKTVDQLYWPVQHDPLFELHRAGKTIERDALADTPLQDNDVILLRGSIDEVDRCESYLMTGKQSSG